MNLEQITTDFLTRAKAIKPDCKSATVGYSTRFGWEASVHWNGACEISDCTVAEVTHTPESAITSCLNRLRDDYGPDLVAILGLDQPELRECA